MALSSLLLKEGSSCPQTKAVIAKYASQALQLDPNNELARKILLAVEQPETNFVQPATDTATITSKQGSQNNKKSNVVAWQQKEAKILGNKYKTRP